MRTKEPTCTIIQNIGACINYDFEAIDESAFRAFSYRLEQLDKKQRTTTLCLIKALECFLQITGQRLTGRHFSHPKFHEICREFLGAINSERFISIKSGQRYVYSVELRTLLKSVKEQFPKLIALDFNASALGPTEYISGCIQQFERIELKEEKVWLWRGWPVTNRDGNTSWLRLYPIYKRLGRDFTEKLYQACDEYYSSRKNCQFDGIKELAAFIRHYPGELLPEHLQNPLFITQFWRKFFTYYIETGYGANVQVTTLITKWRSHILFFIREYLIPAGVFAEPLGVLPCPEPRRVSGSRTHIKKMDDGTEVKVKLLTNIPLQITDKDAMELLFKKIQADVDLIVHWAELATEDMWKRYQHRLSLAPLGQVRIIQALGANKYGHKWLVDRRNPDFLKNVAATFEHHGFVTKHDIDISPLFSNPLSKTAHDLALPTTGALLPHCVLLVASHPIITPSFLEKLELFDKNGTLVGLVKTDVGYVLVGHKDRKGSDKGQQVVQLTTHTAEVVQQIIELTHPLRNYLKGRNDDNWRYLLLTCGHGFKYPSPIRTISTETSDTKRLKVLSNSLGNNTNLSIEERMDYLRRFSLVSLRASAAVLVYIKERSAKKMAEALGHNEYSVKLLSCYLPEPVMSFFQDRWIRIFQAGIIVEALKNSEYLLEASSFSCMTELDEFLKTHALKIIPKHLENADLHLDNNEATEQLSKAEVVFGVNTGILTAMISLQKAVAKASGQVNGRAKYWAGITEHLVNHLESVSCNRDDLKGYLLAAKRKADSAKMEALIYE